MGTGGEKDDVVFEDGGVVAAGVTVIVPKTVLVVVMVVGVDDVNAPYAAEDMAISLSGDRAMG